MLTFLTIFNNLNNFWQFWQFFAILDIFYNLTIFDNFNIFLQFCFCFCYFDNWKDNPGDLWHLRHWLQFWQLRTWIHDNLWYLTINCDTGQHSQLLQCFNLLLKKSHSQSGLAYIINCKFCKSHREKTE